MLNCTLFLQVNIVFTKSFVILCKSRFWIFWIGTSVTNSQHLKIDLQWNWKLSTSIYDLMLIYVCHFHHHFLLLLLLLLQWSLVKFDHYRDTHAAILDPCIQGIFLINKGQKWKIKISCKRSNFIPTFLYYKTSVCT